MTTPEARIQEAAPSIFPALKIIQHPNTWVANLTTLATAVTAAVAIFHPGFTEPASVQASIASVSVIMASGSQIAHFVTRRNAQTALKVAGITK